MSVLVATDLGVSFGGVRALDGVHIEVAAGEMVGVLGANGAGKTTLFDALSGLIPCTGRIWLNGVEITGSPAHIRSRGGLARSFQDARLFHTMTVLDTLRVASEGYARLGTGVVGILAGTSESRAHERDAAARARDLVRRFGLTAYRDRLISELSTGTRRVVDLACLVIQRPEVILLDEPSSGIAQKEAEALAPLLRQVRDDLGCAFLLIEHDMPLLLSLAERVYALETGRVIAHGTAETIVRDPAVVRSYLGDDPAALHRSGAVTSHG